MELRHLHYFVAVAEESSFTRAARRLEIAQPPLSRQIHDLEEEVGVRLLERNPRGVFLTDAGRRFLSEVRVVLQHVRQAVDAARQVSSGGIGTVRLGIAKGLGDFVSRVVNEYLRLFPSMEIDVRDIASGFQSDAFMEHTIDVGFLRPPVEAPQLVSAPLFQERFSVVLQKTHPLAKHKSLRLEHLAGETFLLIDRHISPGAYDKALQILRREETLPKIVPTATMPYEEAGAILVSSGKGIYLAVGKDPIHPSFADRLVALPLADPSAVIEVHIVWRKDEQAKTTLDFVRFARAMFPKKLGSGYLGPEHRSRLLRPGNRKRDKASLRSTRSLTKLQLK